MAFKLAKLFLFEYLNFKIISVASFPAGLFRWKMASIPHSNVNICTNSPKCPNSSPNFGDVPGIAWDMPKEKAGDVSIQPLRCTEQL